LTRAVDLAEKELAAKGNGNWSSREVRAAAKALDEARYAAVERLKLVRYFHRHAHWLQQRFPDAQLRDVEGLVKLVKATIGALRPADTSDLRPRERMRILTLRRPWEIHVELADLNTEAVELAAKIVKSFEGLGI
jgi:type I restriction enzyme M protein